MASWLVCSSTDRAAWVRALARDTVLCSWARHFTLTVPLSTQEYKWVPVICWGNLTNCWGVTCDGLASRPGGVEILLAASRYGNRDKLRPDEPVGSIRLHLYRQAAYIRPAHACCKLTQKLVADSRHTVERLALSTEHTLPGSVSAAA